MTDTEFRDELEELLKRHASDLDAEDLRSGAAYLTDIAEKWEVLK